MCAIKNVGEGTQQEEKGDRVSRGNPIAGRRIGPWSQQPLAQRLYSIGRFLRRTIPSPWNHSRRNCLAAPSGVLVHSTVTRSLLVWSECGSNVSQEMAMLIDSFGSSTPFGGSMFRRCGLVVLKAKPMRAPPELVICNWEKGQIGCERKKELLAFMK